MLPSSLPYSFGSIFLAASNLGLLVLLTVLGDPLLDLLLIGLGSLAHVLVLLPDSVQQLLVEGLVFVTLGHIEIADYEGQLAVEVELGQKKVPWGLVGAQIETYWVE